MLKPSSLWYVLWQTYKTNTGDIIVKGKIETMTLENIVQRVKYSRGPRHGKGTPKTEQGRNCLKGKGTRSLWWHGNHGSRVLKMRRIINIVKYSIKFQTDYKRNIIDMAQIILVSLIAVEQC